MEFNLQGNLFTDDYKVYLINVRGLANSAQMEDDKQLSLKEVIRVLEATREALEFE